MHYHLKCAREEKWYQNWKARQRRYSFYASIIQPGQMAEGLLRAIHGDVYEVHSAGIKGSQVDPRAIRVMNEIGIDISHQRSKSLDEYRGITFDLAVIVCDKAKEKCPLCGINMRGIGKALPAKEAIHRTFEDPATAKGSDEEQLNAFRRVRDEMKSWIAQTFRT